MKNVTIINKRFKNIETSDQSKNKLKLSLKIFFYILISTFFLFSFTKTKKKPEKVEFKYFACFCSVARKENLYTRELIQYYVNIGFEKFIFRDNNLLNSEKLSDVIQDYNDNGTVDIIDIFGSSIGQSEFFTNIYEKYKTQCAWIAFFDFDEYLKIYLIMIRIKQSQSRNIYQILFLPNVNQ